MDQAFDWDVSSAVIVVVIRFDELHDILFLEAVDDNDVGDKLVKDLHQVLQGLALNLRSTEGKDGEIVLIVFKSMEHSFKDAILIIILQGVDVELYHTELGGNETFQLFSLGSDDFVNANDIVEYPTDAGTTITFSKADAQAYAALLHVGLEVSTFEPFHLQTADCLD